MGNIVRTLVRLLLHLKKPQKAYQLFMPSQIFNSSRPLDLREGATSYALHQSVGSKFQMI